MMHDEDEGWLGSIARALDTQAGFTILSCIS